MKKRVLTVAVLAVVVFVVARRAPQIDREGYWRNPSLWDLFAPPVEGMYRASILKSFQQVTATAGTITIASVTVTSSIATYGGCTTSDAASTLTTSDAFPIVQVASATTVTVTFGLGLTGETCTIQVLEFYPSVLTQAIQRNTITMNAGVTSNTASVTSVNVNKAWLYSTQSETPTTATNKAQTSLTRIVLTSATVITYSRQGDPDSQAMNAAFQLADFK